MGFDVWGIGCCILEFILGFVPFRGTGSESSTLESILYECLVGPLEELPFQYRKNMQRNVKNNIWETVRSRCPKWIDLLRKMMHLDYRQRIDSSSAWEEVCKIKKGLKKEPYECEYNIFRPEQQPSIQDKKRIFNSLQKAGLEEDDPAYRMILFMYDKYRNHPRCTDTNIILDTCIMMAVKYRLYSVPIEFFEQEAEWDRMAKV